MKCPHCGKDIPGKECPNCGAESPIDSRYCTNCGNSIEESESSPDSWSDDGEEFDMEDRVLCPDGTCNGIIIDGKCTECGKKYRQ
ncbi:MAG: zinc-ribbon domain-containing protein [Deltaproteobacteria bacterium]|nr:zinc-ribbon domain-containing protein [Deltaproteobacteria bacterium]